MASQRGNSNGPLLALLAAAALSVATAFLIIEADPGPAPDAPGARTAVPGVTVDGPGAALPSRQGDPEVTVESAPTRDAARAEVTPAEAAGDCLLRAVDALTGEPLPADSARLTGLRDLAAPQVTLLPEAPGEPITVPYEGQALLVRVAVPGYVSTELRVDGPGPRRVALERARSLIGVVIVAGNGAPSSGAQVTVHLAADVDGDPLLTGRTDGDGRVTLGPLETGDYAVRVTSSEGRADPAPLTVGAGPTSLEIRLSRD